MRYDLYGRMSHSRGRVQQQNFINDITDKDTALIFSLIFLLRKERRDPMLILALLYILT